MHAAGLVWLVLVVHRFVECGDTFAGWGGEVMHSMTARIVEMRLPQRRLDLPRCHRYALRNGLMSDPTGFIPVCTDIQNIAAPGFFHAKPLLATYARMRCHELCQTFIA